MPGVVALDVAIETLEREREKCTPTMYMGRWMLLNALR